MTSCSDKPAEVATNTEKLPDRVSFNEHIRPILANNCSSCHGGVKKSGGLSYVFEEEAIAQGASGNFSIVPGSPNSSYLITKVTSKDPDVRMPPPEHGPALSDHQIELLKQWISEGAKWEEHWAFKKPESVSAPLLENDDWSRNELDSFILRRLRAENLSPSKEANKGALLRRVSLDLTGVPPTEAEFNAFLSDTSENAYEKVVDRLLASKRYGERWASMWLDLARYADSQGLGQDTRRPTIYKFRDWVIQAFNEDMPYDEFTVKQIAGDLLPNANLDDYIATAFHRNTQAEDEGGTDDEEFRIVSQIDRINTTWQVWHGTTMGCVQCHSHPYDPIRHDEYYRFMDFFNNTQDGDLKQEYPHIKVPVSPDSQKQVAPLVDKQRTLIERIWKVTSDLKTDSEWTWLSDMRSTTNRPKQMKYEFERRDGREEFVFNGTPTFITQTITAPIPNSETPLQALRLDIRPHVLENAAFKPSPGFRLSKINVFLSSPNGDERELDLDAIYRDEPFPFLEANVKGDTGYSALNYISHDRWAVFRFKEAVVPAEGETFKIVLQHGKPTGQKDLMLIRRGSIGYSNDPRWRTFDRSSEYTAMTDELATLENELYKEKQISVPIMVERPEHLRRGTKTFIRGNWTTLGETQFAATPAVFHPLAESNEPKRLQMARWLVNKENPLSARVLVSRFWEQLFGTGLVETLEDFGSVGLPPSHPELLDYLANSLMHEYNWSMKSLLRFMVTSSAYRQDNSSTPELNKQDPKNRLLARGPRTRLTGEMIRDQVLALGDTLNDKMYGTPIMPEQPDGGWTPSHGAAGKWVESSEEESNRRSVYILWQRSSTYPVLMAFDAPTRELCSDRRINSNTPIQPLFTLNDPALFKATQKFGTRMQKHQGSLAEKIAYGYRLATAQDAPSSTIEKLVSLHDKVIQLYPENEAGMKEKWDAEIARKFKKRRNTLDAENKQKINRAKKKKLDPPSDLPDPELIQPGPQDAFNYSAPQAAFDNIATVILNLDATLNK